MKKYLTAIATAIVATISANATAPQSTADSLGYYIGRTQGSAMLKRTNDMPADAQQTYKDDFIRAFRLVMTADTSATGFIDGINVACAALNEINKMENAGIPVNRNMLAEEFEHAFSAGSIDEATDRAMMDTLQSILIPLQQQVRRRSEQAREQAQRQWEELADRNLAAGRDYITRAKEADHSINTTPSGLAYKVIKNGTGTTATDSDMVELIYTGKRIDGTVFDSSNGNTVKFSPKSVIRGFSEGLKLMNKGAKYTLYIPAELAYGMQAPPAIGPNATLIFDIEVTDIQPADK